VLVTNRSFEKAEALASEFGGRAVRYEDRLSGMTEADIVVSSTGSPHAILHRDEVAALMPARRNRPLFLIDIAVPRDIETDVQTVPNVYLYNVDHLESIVRENVRSREQELTACHDIIRERSIELLARFAPRRSAATAPQPWELTGAVPCHA
jgi:glutamyl-tRNA reductase